MHAGAETHFLALTLSQKETSSVYTLLSKYTIRCYNLQKKMKPFSSICTITSKDMCCMCVIEML